MTDSGLLFVYGECGPNVTEEEFNDWYDNEHGPMRLTVPGFANAVRYKSIDGRLPSWLAIYDLESPAIGTSDAYKALGGKASDRERALIPRLADLNRSILQLVSTTLSPSASSSSVPGKFVLVVSGYGNASLEEENKLYSEEHAKNLRDVPGFLRMRSYKLVSNVQLAGTALGMEGPPHNFFILFEADREDINELPEWKAMMTTPQALSISSELKIIQLRRFALHKNIPRPE